MHRFYFSLLLTLGPLFCALSVLWAEAGRPGMVFIPAGKYLRGRSHSLPDDHLKWFPTLLKDDQPARRIFVSAFYLDEHEVTNEQYLAFVKATRHAAPYNWPKGKLPAGKEKFPVVDVSWAEATAYCRWAGKRLPTEAEWERAARGLVEGKKYPWGDDLPTKDNSRFDSLDGPGEVRQFKPNYFGVYDTAGNVWEWCSDWYAKDYYESAPPRDPLGPNGGLYRVLRGGSWADEPKFLTCAHRSWARPVERSPNIGFRCAQSLRRLSSR
ncbi:MAG: formylglycine-generating enzyme family protein [Acidobacteria bacterium]|nr:formylglycine-generating enzyme family protein [Acidobacteriota bacterium]MCI0623672.1 formylglycine-generating enzyme family protein [Acidobacteriota bacterium]MCI0719935.1 formylglycine-generating enzyme family protein [Acidobacteriota bacterium]